MSWEQRILEYVEKKGLLLIQFDQNRSTAILSSRKHGAQFSFSEPHDKVNEVKPNTLCIIFFQESEGNYSCNAGIIQSIGAITTIDSRASIRHSRQILPSSFLELVSLITDTRSKNILKRLSGYSFAVLAPKTSRDVLKAMLHYEENKHAFERIYKHLLIRTRGSDPRQFEQKDAIGIALAAFGLQKSEMFSSVSTCKDSDSILNYWDSEETYSFLEDNVINNDSRVIPGFNLIKSDITGRATFTNSEELLVVYTANRGPLEKMLGVDLIYYNETRMNIVMVQYKMLEKGKSVDSKWKLQLDEQFHKEIDRMSLIHTTTLDTDYRLNPTPYYFKFIHRKSANKQSSTYIITLEHLKMLLPNDGSKSITVDYDKLSGRYLRDTDFIALIRSGYIGTHSNHTAHLSSIIDEVAKGNKGVVLAWQSRINRQNANNHGAHDEAISD